MPGLSEEEISDNRKAMKAVKTGSRVVEVQCPIHRDQVIAILTRDGLILDSTGSFGAAGATHPLMAVCRLCDGDPDYRLDPKKLRAIPMTVKTRPAKITADRVRFEFLS